MEEVLIPKELASTLCPWLLDQKINISILSDWKNPIRDNADFWVEEKIGHLLGELFGMNLTHHSSGNFPDYDIILDGNHFIEIKLSSFQNNKTIFIETSKESQPTRNSVKKKVPSGLSLSRAKHYVMLNPGKTKVGDKYNDVMKLRVISTDVLKNLAKTTVETSIGIQGNKLSYGFEIDLFEPDFNDGCLGHFKYSKETKTIDFSNFTKYNKEILSMQSEFRSVSIPGVTTKG